MTDRIQLESGSYVLMENGSFVLEESSTLATAPGAPTGVTAVKNNAFATVIFTAPASNGGSAITGYTATSTPGSFTATGASSPLNVSGLTNGTSYTFTVHATNTNGDSSESAPSNAVVPSTTPGAPTGVVCSGTGPVTISFVAPASDGGDAIDLYRVTAQTGGTTFTGTSSPITVTGLTPGSTYTFTVAAHNSNGYGAESTPTGSVTYSSNILNAVVLLPFTDNDVIGTPGYAIYQITSGVAVLVSSRVTSGIAALPGTYNGYAADVSVLANQANGSFKGLLKADTGETTFVANRTAGSAVISGIPSTTGFTVGQGISGTGIPADATILSRDSSTQITLTAAATSGSASPTTFTRANYVWDQLTIEPPVSGGSSSTGSVSGGGSPYHGDYHCGDTVHMSWETGSLVVSGGVAYVYKNGGSPVLTGVTETRDAMGVGVHVIAIDTSSAYFTPGDYGVCEQNVVVGGQTIVSKYIGCFSLQNRDAAGLFARFIVPAGGSTSELKLPASLVVAVNQLQPYQVNITYGDGRYDSRAIDSNTATVALVSPAFSTALSAVNNSYAEIQAISPQSTDTNKYPKTDLRLANGTLVGGAGTVNDKWRKV